MWSLCAVSSICLGAYMHGVVLMMCKVLYSSMQTVHICTLYVLVICLWIYLASKTFSPFLHALSKSAGQQTSCVAWCFCPRSELGASAKWHLISGECGMTRAGHKTPQSVVLVLRLSLVTRSIDTVPTVRLVYIMCRPQRPSWQPMEWIILVDIEDPFNYW